MAESLDEIVVTIRAETEKFEKGMDKASDSLDDFQKDSKKTASKSDDLKKSFDKTGDSADNLSESLGDTSKSTQDIGEESEKTEKKIDNLNDGLESEADNADKSSQSLKGNADKTKDLGNESDTTKDKIKKLNDVLKVFGMGFSVVAIITALKNIVDKLIEIQDEAVNTQNKLNTLYGDPLIAGEMQGIIQRDNQILKGNYTSELKAEVTIAVEKDFKKLLDDEKTILKQEILDLSGATGMSASEIADDIKMIVDKWGKSEEEAIDVLQRIKAISNEQFGADFAKNFSENITVYAKMDDIAQAYGFSFDEFSKIMLNLNSSNDNNYKNITESLGLLKQVMIIVQDAIEDAQIAVQTLPDKIALLKLELDTADSDSERQKILQEINESQAKLSEAQEIISKSQTELLKEILAGKDYTSIDIKKLEEFSQVREIIVSSATITLPETPENYQSYTKDSWGNTAGKNFSRLGYEIGEYLSPNEYLQALQESNDKLRSELFQKIDETYGPASKERLEAVQVIDNPSGKSNQERQENVAKLIVEYDLKYFDGAITGAKEDIEPLLEPLETVNENIDAIDTTLEDISKKDLTNISESIDKVAESSEKASDKLEDANEQIDGMQTTIEKVDTTDAVKQVDNLTESISGDDGVTESTVKLTDAQALNATAIYDVLIPSDDDLIVSIGNVMFNVDKLVDSWLDSVDTINKSVIPANDNLISSLKDVASAYREVESAKASAGM